LKEHLKDVKDQAMYCVIHGGLDRELRKKSVDYLTSLPFDVSTERDSGRAFSLYRLFLFLWLTSSCFSLYLIIYRAMQLEAAWARIRKSCLNC
jgi:hypothetical protein